MVGQVRGWVGLVVLTLTMSALATVAAAEVVALEPDRDSFKENMDPEVDVSGQMLSGLMFGGSQGASSSTVDLQSLHVSFAYRPGRKGDTICFRLASRDGVYTANWQSTLPADIGDGAEIGVAIDSSHESELEARYHADELVAVAVASVNDHCGIENGARYLPTVWKPAGMAKELSARQLMVSLNTDAAAVYSAVRTKAGDIKKVQCRVLPESEEKVTFDTVCELPAVVDSDRLVELSVLTRYGSAVGKPVVYALR